MFLKDIAENQDLKQVVYVLSTSVKESKAGKKYLTGEVRDKTELVRFNLWDIASLPNFMELPKEGDYAEFIGRLEVFNGTRQINLKSCKILNPDNIDKSLFKKVTTLDVAQMWQELEVICGTFTDKFVKFLTQQILKDPIIERFKQAPAAESVHNAWASGLLEHSLAVAKISDFVVCYYNEIYFRNKINRDIVVFTSLFHDIGKIWEYDFDTPNIKTTAVGELLGHIYLGTKKLEDLAKNYDGKDVANKLNRILHVFLAHHGKYEFGAPVLPKTPEAIIVHFIDNIDARMMNLWENLEGCKDEFTTRNFVQENAKMFNVFKD